MWSSYYPLFAARCSHLVLKKFPSIKIWYTLKKNRGLTLDILVCCFMGRGVAPVHQSDNTHFIKEKRKTS